MAPNDGSSPAMSAPTPVRDTVAIFRRGDYLWERMYTLAHAAAEIRRRATAKSTSVEAVAIAEAEDGAEDEEIARVARELPAESEDIPLADLARRFGIDLDEL